MMNSKTDKIIIISVSDICNINKLETKQDYGARYEKVNACFSSYQYYDSEREQIASIVYNLVKGHIFPDGNKRTSLAVFQILCDLNHIRYDDSNLADKFVDLASHNYSISQVIKILFK